MTREKFLACHYLGSMDERYKQAVDDLNNKYLMGLVKYPESVSDMLHMLTNRRGTGGQAGKRREAQCDGEILTSFHQQAKHVKCWKCKEFGHVNSECPQLTKVEADEEKKNVSILSSSPKYLGLPLAKSAFLRVG